jgi:hypothetical protein
MLKSPREEKEMKRLRLTYHMENDTGNAENCITVSMVDEIAEDILANGADSDYAKPYLYGYVYRLLENLAELQGYEFTEFCSAVEVKD